jgi:DDE family transposase
VPVNPLVDTKKKELVGDFKNAGRTLRPKGEPEPVRVHDFIIKDKGKVSPFGVYDIAANEGWVNVGIDHDTAAFAVESIRRWWVCVPKTLSELMRRWNRLSWRNDWAALIRPNRPGLGIQVEEPA